MNALELLLRRVGSSGNSDPDWLAHLAELGDSLPPPDTVELPQRRLDQGYYGGGHPNALGIYGREDRPPPPGDEVIRPEQPVYAAPVVPRVPASDEQRWFSRQNTPSYFPGPEGSTRISMRGPPGAPQREETGEPSLDPRFRAQQQPLPPGLPLGVQDAIRNQPSYQEGGQFMAPEPYYNPNVGEPVMPRDDPERRDYRLNDLLGFNRWMRREGEWPIPDQEIATPLQPGQSPYATSLPSALNQMLRRVPYGQY